MRCNKFTKFILTMFIASITFARKPKWPCGWRDMYHDASNTMIAQKNIAVINYLANRAHIDTHMSCDTRRTFKDCQSLTNSGMHV